MLTPLAKTIDLPPKRTRKIQSYNSVVTRLEVAAKNYQIDKRIENTRELLNAIKNANRRLCKNHVIRILQNTNKF